MPKLPNWTYDELIVALDLYINRRGNLPTRRTDEVIALSGILRRLGELAGLPLDDKYRNPSGVESKLWNFAFIDTKSSKGRSNGSKLDRLVWEEYSNRPDELRVYAKRICSFVEVGEVPNGLFTLDFDDDVSVEEGRLITRIHQSRERKEGIRNKKIAHMISKNLPLDCACCSFNFEGLYGVRGREYIEVHHKKPVSLLIPGERTRLSDLELVCSNCHRMIHRTKPWLNISELKNLIFHKNSQDHIVE